MVPRPVTVSVLPEIVPAPAVLVASTENVTALPDAHARAESET